MTRATSIADISEYALANGLTIRQAARSMHRQEFLRLLNRSTTLEEIKPIIAYLLLEEPDDESRT